MLNLYHGTLTRNLKNIREQGLLPRPGSVTAAYHEEAAKFVCAADEDHKDGLTRIIIQQMALAGLIRWSNNYSLDDLKRDLVKHASIVVVRAEYFTCCKDISRCPKGVEVGDWYSTEPVSVDGEISREEMLDWLPLSQTNFKHDYYELLRRVSKCKAG